MKNLLWGTMALVACLGILACDSDDDTAAATGGTEATEGAEEATEGAEEATEGAEEATEGAEEATEGAEEATEGAEEATEGGAGEETASEDPCAFALNAEGEYPEGGPVWTEATLGEDSSALCPPADDDFLASANGTDDDDDDDDDDEEEEEEDDCDPVQNTSVDTCSFTVSCDNVSGEFTATEDGNVTATFVVSVEDPESEDDVTCEYEMVGAVELP